MRRQGVSCRRGAIVAALLAAVAAMAAAADERLVDGIAAQVGGSVVLFSEVDQVAAPIEVKMRSGRVPESEILAMRAEILDRLIESRLIANVVRRFELNASESEVDQAIASIAKETGLSLDQLERSVASHGLKLEEYRAKIKAEIERSKVLNSMVRSKVSLEPSELRALYAEGFSNQHQGGTELHLRHLMVAFGVALNRDSDTACAIVAEAAERIESGAASFEQLAREISDANPERGGELGWIHSSDLASWMAPAVSSLENGELSAVVHTDFGCNLLQLVERREFQPVSFEQARTTLENALYRRKMEEEYIRWMDTLRAQTFIERKGVFGDISAASPGDAGR